jgi:hypothetical protein
MPHQSFLDAIVQSLAIARLSRAHRDDGRRSPSLRVSELLFEIFAGRPRTRRDARAEACDSMPQPTIGEAILDCQVRLGVREREQLQLATLDANPLRASRTSMPPIATAIDREVRAARESR